MNENSRTKDLLKYKAPFNWGFMYIILAISPKSLTSETTFSSYLLIVDSYSKITKIYGKDITTTE